MTVAGLIGCLVVSGCGFEPLYGQRQRGVTLTETSLVAVAPIPERVGQLVRNELIDRLNPLGEPDRPRYRLVVTSSGRREGLAFQRDLTVTRYNYTLAVSYVLSDGASGSVVLRGQTRAVAAYNVVQSEFSNVIAERDAEARAAREVGEEVALRVAAFLGNREASQPVPSSK
jgi:LPS-assembly lipoprotein